MKAHNNICLVYTKFNALIWLQVIVFFGGPYRFTCFGALSQHNCRPYLTKVVYAYVHRISYIHVYHIYIYIFIILYIYHIIYTSYIYIYHIIYIHHIYIYIILYIHHIYIYIYLMKYIYIILYNINIIYTIYIYLSPTLLVEPP